MDSLSKVRIELQQLRSQMRKEGYYRRRKTFTLPYGDFYKRELNDIASKHRLLIHNVLRMMNGEGVVTDQVHVARIRR